MSDHLHALAILHPGKSHDTHRIGGWVGPKAGLDGYGEKISLLGLKPQAASL